MTRPITEMTPEQRVAAGVKWLDVHGPSNWRELIDPETLDMTNGRQCILGQVFANRTSHGGYMWVCDHRFGGIDYNNAADYGFVYNRDKGAWLAVLNAGNEAQAEAPKTLDSLVQEYAARIEKVYADGTNGDFTALGILSQFVIEYKSL